MTAWEIVRRETGLNLARNRGAAAFLAGTLAATSAVIVLAGEWYVLVGRAVAVAAGDPSQRAAIAAAGATVAQNVDVQAAQRPVVVGVTLLVCEAIALLMTSQATGPRRRTEASFFRDVLGAPRSYTTWPALLEGLAVGLVGGVLGAIVAVLGAPVLTRLERSTLPAAFDVGLVQPGHPDLRVHIVLHLAAIHLGTVDLVGAASGALLVGVLLSVGNAVPTLRSRPPRPADDPRV